MQLDIDFSDSDLAAIDAAIARRQDAEPGLTREVLLARMVKKLAGGWIQEQVNVVVDGRVAALSARLRSVPAADVVDLVEKLEATLDAVTPPQEKGRRL